MITELNTLTKRYEGKRIASDYAMAINRLLPILNKLADENDELRARIEKLEEAQK